MSEPVVIDKIKKNATTEVWVSIEEYQGQRRVDIRQRFYSPDSTAWLRTQRGVTIPPELLGEAVDAAEALAKSNAVGVVAELDRGKKAKLRFAVAEFQKHVYGELRVYYVKDADSENWKPGKGVTLPLAVLGKLAEGLRMAEEYLDSQ